MALIRCSECNKEYSEFANVCPNCGCPTNINQNSYTSKALNISNIENENTINKKSSESDISFSNKIKKIIVIIGTLIIIFAIILGIYFYDDNQREIDYQNRYEIAMATYNTQLEQYNQCNINLSNLDLLPNNPKYILAQTTCMSLKPEKPIVWYRKRIFNLPFFN